MPLCRIVFLIPTPSSRPDALVEGQPDATGINGASDEINQLAERIAELEGELREQKAEQAG